jgi:hypothetical protein
MGCEGQADKRIGGQDEQDEQDGPGEFP